MGEHSKLDRVKTMSSRGKINSIWWNIKINLQKLVNIWGIWTANKFTKFHTKRLNWSENIPKSFRGLLFSETFFLWYKTSVLWCQSLAWVNWNSCNRKSIHHKMSGERGYCLSARCQCDVPALLYASEWGGWALPLEGHIKIAWKYSTTAVVQAH